LVTLGQQLDIAVYSEQGADPVKGGRNGVAHGKQHGFDVVVLDTAGRLHIDEEMMSADRSRWPRPSHHTRYTSCATQ